MQESTITPIPIDRIAPSPRNPRQSLGHLDELTDSIRAYGLLQPIVVREHDDGRFEVVAGHRRFAAVQSLGWSTVPAIVRQADQGEAYLLALIENLQRDNLSPREEAEALEILVRENRLSTRQVAEAVKRSASYVSRRLRVFEDPVLAPLVLQRALTVSAAEELLPLPAPRKRALAQQAAEEGWDRLQVRFAVDGQSAGEGPRKTALARRARELRMALRDKLPGSLTEAERRELRLLFRDLTILAKAPTEERPIVIPPIPVPRAAQG
jgi:ParB family transcriptional regulator, chromosome partitioning protein